MLIQEEKQREIRSSGHFLGDSASLAVEVHKPNFSYKGKVQKVEGRMDTTYSRFNRVETKRVAQPIQSNIFCTYCKKPGHSIDKCYRLHGFPPNFKFKNPRRATVLVQTHDTDSGPLTQHPNAFMSQHTNAFVSCNSTVPGLTPEQSSQLITMLQNVQLNKEGQEVSQATPTAFTSFAGTTLCEHKQTYVF